jgi:hypothetical protein
MISVVQNKTHKRTIQTISKHEEITEGAVGKEMLRKRHVYLINSVISKYSILVQN